MSVIRSKLDTRSDDYRDNLAEMERLWAEVAEQLAAVPSIGAAATALPTVISGLQPGDAR